MQLKDLETPALILDRHKLTENAERMFNRASDLGVTLRPHVKTLKSIEAAKIYAPPPSPITVSTLLEAEAFAKAGYSDILYSVGAAPNILPRVARLIASGTRITLFVDSVAAARAVSDAAQSLSVPLEAMIEVDVDGHRAGLAPEGAELLDVAAALTDGKHAALRGVAAHAGESYSCSSLDEIAAMAEQERKLTVMAAQRLRKAGYSADSVSVGSTPTALCARNLDGVTELRAGVYASFDLVMAGLGVCDVADIAMSVLCTVIGHQPDKGWVLVNAGWMATSGDLGTSTQVIDQRYGLVCEASGAVLNDYVLNTTNQEQGIITRRDGGPINPSDFPYGSCLRILPVHACATGAQHDRYYVTDGGEDITAQWQRVNSW